MANLLVEHPTPVQLRFFYEGKLEPDDFTAIEEHLDSCEACCRALEESPADSFVGRLKCAQQAAFATTVESNAATLHEVTGIPPELANHPRYRVLQLVGQGGMGAVYKAEHRRMERVVALKVINPGLMKNPATVSRFQQEVRAAAKLAHPNIVTAHDADQAGGLHFLVMEYVEGKTLADLLTERGPLPIPEACEYIRQAAVGLQHLHEAGLIHRDIKPHNLMVVSGGVVSGEWSKAQVGQVKILDCGLARFADAPESSDSPLTTHHSPLHDSPLTTHGTVMGTADYIAPEQIADARAADIRSDIYSLGCTFYHLLTGQPPFADGTNAEKFRQHAVSPFPLKEEWPVALKDILRRMTRKSPNERFATPIEIARALESFGYALKVRPLAANSSEPMTSAKRERPRRRSLIAAALLALAALIAIAAIVIIKIQTDKGEITIATDDPNIEIITKKGGEIVRIRDPKSGQTWELDTKKLTMRDLEHPDGLALEVPWKGKVTFKSSGGKVVVSTEKPDAVVFPWLSGDRSGWEHWYLWQQMMRKQGTFSPESDKDLLQGRWIAESSEERGQPLPPLPADQSPQIEIEGSSLRLMIPGSPAKPATFKIDPDANPREIDIIRNEDEKGMRGIYRFEGDKLILCIGEPGPNRPREFKTSKDTGTLKLMTLRRANAKPQFQPLFNGKDLSGWKTNKPQNWKVADGTIVGTDGQLAFERPFADFHCRIELRIKGMGDFGFRGTADNWVGAPIGDKWLSENTGSLIHVVEGKVDVLVDQKKSLIASDGWFTMEVIAIGKKAIVRLNGETTAEKIVPGMLDSGIIDFKAERPDGKLEIRKIEIMELPSSPETGFQPLFDGEDLSEWKGDKSIWSVKDGDLVAKLTGANAKSAASPFILPRKMRDFELRFQARLKDGLGGCLVGFRTSDEETPKGFWIRLQEKQWGQIVSDFRPLPAVAFLANPDKYVRGVGFNDFTLRCEGKKVTLTINGETIWKDIECPDLPEEGSFDLLPLIDTGNALEPGGRDVEITFRNMRIRELPSSKSAFQPLFNGKDLTGWTSSEDRYFVKKDGSLLANPVMNEHGMLRTTQSFDNYELRLQCQLAGHGSAGSKTNAGVAFQVGADPNRTNPSYGIALRITSGRDWDISAHGIGDVGEVKLGERKNGPAEGGWHDLRVVSRDGRFTVYFNGDERWSCSRLPRTKGQIGLWALDGDVTFRNIEIRKLPPSSPETGFQPLFNDKDLTGWKAIGVKGNANPELAWEVLSGLIIAKSSTGYIRTTKAYENYVLEFEWRGPTTQNSCLVYLHIQEPDQRDPKAIAFFPRDSGPSGIWPPDGKPGLLPVEVKDVPLTPGDWQKVAVECRDSAISIALNGKPAFHKEGYSPAKGFIGLGSNNREVHFRNVRIKELTAISGKSTRSGDPVKPVANPKATEPELLPVPREHSAAPKLPASPLDLAVRFPQHLYLVRAKLKEIDRGGVFGAPPKYVFSIEHVYAGPATLKGTTFRYESQILIGSGPMPYFPEKQLFFEWRVGVEALWWLRSSGNAVTPVLAVHELEAYAIERFPYIHSTVLFGHHPWQEGLAWAAKVEEVYRAKSTEERGKLLRRMIATGKPHIVRWAAAMIAIAAEPDVRKEYRARAEKFDLSIPDALLVDRLLSRIANEKTFLGQPAQVNPTDSWLRADTRERLLRLCLETESDSEFELACRRLNDAIRDHEIEFTMFAKVLDPIAKKATLSVEQQWSLGKLLAGMRFEVQPGPFAPKDPRKPIPYGSMTTEERAAAFDWLLNISANARSTTVHLHAAAGLKHLRPFSDERKGRITSVLSQPERGPESHEVRDWLFSPIPTQEDENVARRTAHNFAAGFATQLHVYIKGPFYLGGWLVPRESGWELPIKKESLEARVFLEKKKPYLPAQVTTAELLDLTPALTRDPLMKAIARFVRSEKNLFYVVTLSGSAESRVLIQVSGGRGFVRGFMPPVHDEPDPDEPAVREIIRQFIDAHNAKEKDKLKDLVGSPWCHGGKLWKVIDRKTTIELYPNPTFGSYEATGALGHPGFGPKFPEKLPEAILHVARLADHHSALLATGEDARGLDRFMGPRTLEDSRRPDWPRGYVVFLGKLDEGGGAALLVRIDADAKKTRTIKVVGTLNGLH